MKSKAKKSKSPIAPEVLPVLDESSDEDGGSGEQIDTTSGLESLGEESSDDVPKRKEVSADQAVRKKDDAPSPKQLTLALGIKAHYDSTHKHGVKIDKKSKESISTWMSQMIDISYQPPWDESKKKNKKPKTH